MGRVGLSVSVWPLLLVLVGCSLLVAAAALALGVAAALAAGGVALVLTGLLVDFEKLKGGR